MKPIISKAIALIIFSTAIFSFTTKPGGEGFEIFLNNKVMLQQYGADMNAIQNLQLGQDAYNEQLTIKYYHCGKVAKNRVITIKDAQNRLLKEFRYADAPTPMDAMALNVKEILNLKKASNGVLKLYYFSSEMTKERLLTSIVVEASTARL